MVGEGLVIVPFTTQDNKPKNDENLKTMEKTMRYILIVIAVVLAAGILYANGIHQHQTRHKHQIGDIELYIDGEELTDDTRENLTGWNVKSSGV